MVTSFPHHMLRNTSKRTWGKTLQMRPMRLCFCLGKQLEKTFNDSQWTKIAWMQPLFSCSLNLEHEVFEVLNETFAPSIRNKLCYRRIKHHMCFKSLLKNKHKDTKGKMGPPGPPNSNAPHHTHKMQQIQRID